MPLFNSRLLFRVVGLIALASLFAGPAKAVESAWDATPEARARLLSAVDATGSDGELRFGIEFVLKDGWKTYWRAPGPQGYPPNLEWDGSDNIASAEITWPTPRALHHLRLRFHRLHRRRAAASYSKTAGSQQRRRVLSLP